MPKAPNINIQALPEWAWLAVGVGAFWLWNRGIRGATSDAVQAVGNVGAGIIEGIGEAVGIPKTDKAKCDKALAENNGADAGKYCSAGTLIMAMPGSFSDWMAGIFKEEKPVETQAGPLIVNKPKATQPKATQRTGYPSTKPGVIVEQSDCGITGLLCGPSFESDSKSWLSDSAIWQQSIYDASGEILRPVSITPVNGIRG